MPPRTPVRRLGVVPTSPPRSRLRAALRAIWDEPQVPPPERTPWWDVAIAAVLVVASVVEAIALAVPWPVWHVALATVVATIVIWRSRRPLAVLVVAFSAQTLAGVVPALLGEPYAVLNTTAVLLLLAYSLGRWASGRAVAAGVIVLMAGHFGREPLYGSSATQNVIGAAALLLPVALGAMVRFWTVSRTRALDQARMRERADLARELHDTVAHHVAAIVVQAQAGQAIAAADPERAVGVLTTVERAATEALGEMRAMVGVLRDGRAAELAPPAVLTDLRALAAPPADTADGSPGAPRVRVEVPARPEVPAAIAQTMLRVAQESVANARWHAVGATVVDVAVTVGGGLVRLDVVDDGAPGLASARGTGGGFGIAGMTERVEALGGTFHAGPGDTGWRVTASIPMEGQR